MKKLMMALLGVASIAAANAATTSTSFDITGTLANTCTVANTGDVALGDLSAVQTGGTTINVDCRNGATYNMTVSSANSWTLVNGSDSVAYVLSYLGAVSGVETNWSAASGGAVTATPIVGNGLAQAYPLQVQNSAAGASLLAGTYSDTVTVNVNYS